VANKAEGRRTLEAGGRHILRYRYLVLSLAALSMTVAFVPPAEAQADRSYTYQVETRGTVYTDRGEFAADVRDILGDARGWTLGGSVAFQPVASNADLRVILASPSAVEQAHSVCHRNYSCRVGDSVYINDRNWRNSTRAFRDAGGDLSTYREYLINHEVGHFLGFGHYDCPSRGGRAHVMQQQSISLQGCEPAGWPSDFERSTLGERLGVQVHDDWIFTDVLHGQVHRADIHALADAEVASGYVDGTYRPTALVTRGQIATLLTRALGLQAGGSPDFEDVPADHPHAHGIAAVQEHGLVSGFEDGTFRPEDHVVRGQMATMMAVGYDLEADAEPHFDDVPADHPHAEGIAAVTEAEVASGFEDGTYRPGSRVTRGQMAAFIARAGIDG
jgi:hypothetical protein